ncbi:MAG: hypothetical protein ABI559_11805 [Chloroflexota bacterium]
MPDTPEINEPECPHTAMVPHWDQPGDMGKVELATYKCESCSRTFSYQEAQQFLSRPPAVLSKVVRAPESD